MLQLSVVLLTVVFLGANLISRSHCISLAAVR
jgi:hypothetical protein